MFGLEMNTLLSVMALLIIVYVLYRDAKDDKTAGEVAKSAVSDIRGEVNSRAVEMEELQKEVHDFKQLVEHNMDGFVSEDQRLTSEVEALKLKVGALEMRRPSAAAFKVEPIKVEPVVVSVKMLYPKRQASVPQPPPKIDLEPARKQIEKTVRQKK